MNERRGKEFNYFVRHKKKFIERAMKSSFCFIEEWTNNNEVLFKHTLTIILLNGKFSWKQISRIDLRTVFRRQAITGYGMSFSFKN